MQPPRVRRPSPAMVVALLALCVALGGSAIAATKLAPKNSVNSASVVDNSLRLADFKKSERVKLKGAKGAKGDPGIQGPAGTPDGYTKTEADAKFLGKSDASGFVQGAGSQSSVFRVFADNDTAESFVSVPNIGHLGFHCGSTMTLSFVDDSLEPIAWEMNDTGTLSSHQTAPSTFPVFVLGSTAHQIVAQFHRTGQSATLVMSIFRGATGDNATDCRVQAQVIASTG